jgi:hypothetical protein
LLEAPVKFQPLDEKSFRLCHHYGMAKKTKKKIKKRNPTDPSLLALEVVEAAIGESLTLIRQ